jgi:hypothetical protein
MRGSDITFTMQPFDGGAHVCMTHKIPEHNTEGFDCWCKPTITILCSECADNDAPCWKCGGEGWIHMDAFAAEQSGLPAVIIHNENAKP